MTKEELKSLKFYSNNILEGKVDSLPQEVKEVIYYLMNKAVWRVKDLEGTLDDIRSTMDCSEDPYIDCETIVNNISLMVKAAIERKNSPLYLKKLK